jgi:hypothetical protein
MVLKNQPNHKYGVAWFGLWTMNTPSYRYRLLGREPLSSIEVVAAPNNHYVVTFLQIWNIMFILTPVMFLLTNNRYVFYSYFLSFIALFVRYLLLRNFNDRRSSYAFSWIIQTRFLVSEAEGNFIQLFIFANFDMHGLHLNKVMLPFFVVENMGPAWSKQKWRCHWLFRFCRVEGNFIRLFI